MMAGDHFPRKNALLSTQRMRKKLWFFKKQAHFQGFLGAVLKTLCEPVFDLEDSPPVTKIQTLNDELFGSEKPLFSIMLDFQ